MIRQFDNLTISPAFGGAHIEPTAEIIGISTEVLDKVAEDIAKEFNQVEVLVKNYEENRIYLVK